MSQSIRVLIADDQEVLRDALAAVIRSDHGMQVVAIAADADEAVALAQRTWPEVAILDVKMPGGGGSRAAKEISARLPMTKIIAYTAHADRGTVFDMLRSGATGYVVKGSSADQILTAIRQAAAGGSALSPDVARLVVEHAADDLQRRTATEDGQRAELHRLQSAMDSKMTVAYQPIVELASGKCVGYEALARFANPARQAPDQWFAQAAAAGILQPFERAAMGKAIAGAIMPAGLFLCVNLSPETVLETDPGAMVPEVPPLVIEITEHAPVEDYDALAPVIDRLRQRGVRLAIDDAGAGFASMRHILRLEPDLIKLDMSITRSVDSDRKRRSLAAALISFAAESGIEVIAEGIETDSERTTLGDLGAKYGQGFLLGRPGALPIDVRSAA